MSVRAETDCAIRDAHDQSLVWWPDTTRGGVVMRCSYVETMGLQLKMKAEVRHPDGTVPPPLPPPTAMAHDVFRFVRMSRTAENLYDSYRNLFLAFECLLSDMRPVQLLPNGRQENEKQWFTAALAVADQLVPLASLVPNGITDPVEWIYNNIYSAERSALMHAKRQYLLPQDDTRKQRLTDSLGDMSTYIGELIKQHFGVSRRNQSWSLAAVEVMAKAVLGGFAMIVSDDDSGPINPNADNQIAPSASMVELQPSTPAAADPNDPTLWTLLAARDTDDLAELATIRRFGLKPLKNDDDTAWVVSDFLGPLDLGSAVKRLEMLHGFRHINRTDAPRVFTS